MEAFPFRSRKVSAESPFELRVAVLLIVILFILAFPFAFLAIKGLRELILKSSRRIFSSLDNVSEQVVELTQALRAVQSELQATHAEIVDLQEFVRESKLAHYLSSTVNSNPINLCGLITASNVDYILVNLGCGGTYHSHWINLDLNAKSPDVYCVDVSSRLPFDDHSVDVAYASHLLEHLAPHQAPCLMLEVYRVLKPGGIFRVVVPDLEQITNEYLRTLQQVRLGDESARLYHEWMLIELIDQAARQTPDGGEMLRFLLRHGESGLAVATERLGEEIVSTTVDWDATKTKAEWIREIADDEAFCDDAIFARRRSMTHLDTGKFRRSGEPHLWMYDEISLAELFASTGYSDIVRMTGKSSKIPGFESYHLDVTSQGILRKPDSLFLEATKPLT